MKLSPSFICYKQLLHFIYLKQTLSLFVISSHPGKSCAGFKITAGQRTMSAAALKHGIRNPETESRKRKRNTESVKEGSKRSI